MIIIFNYAGIAFCVLGVFGGWAVRFAAWALGFGDSIRDVGFLAAFCAAIALLDLACRAGGILNPSYGSLRRFIVPSTGGQIFFIPIWILAVVLFVYQVAVHIT